MDIESQPWFSRLGNRTEFFKFVVGHLERSFSSGLDSIVETGTARKKDNWSGDGQSTLIWDWAAELLPLHVHSLDISESNIEEAKAQTKYVNYILGDSVKSLSEIRPAAISKCSVLYLDSFDWTPQNNIESSVHHLMELATVWAAIPSGCLIAVDDCHTHYLGKHIMVREFFNHHKISPSVVGYVTAWIKP